MKTIVLSKLSKRAKRAAKKLFVKQPRITRAFTGADYAALPKGESNG